MRRRGLTIDGARMPLDMRGRIWEGLQTSKTEAWATETWATLAC
jgi:hypothetical protein